MNTCKMEGREPGETFLRVRENKGPRGADRLLQPHLELYFLRMESSMLTSSSVLMNFCVLRPYIFS